VRGTIRIPGFLLLGISMAAISGGTVQESTSAPAISWHKDYNAAVGQARAEGRPLLIDFWATWCPPCREMEAKLWARPDVAVLAAKYVCVRVDVDQERALANRFRADSLPTVVFTDPWGTEIARRQGFGDPLDYIPLIRDLPGDLSPLAGQYERLAQNGHDLAALLDIARFYYRKQLFHTSREFYERALEEKAVQADPDVRADILTAIGWNLLKSGDSRGARKRFERCLKEIPVHPGVEVTLYGLLRAQIATGDRAEAEETLQRMRAANPKSPLVEQARIDLAAGELAGR